MKERFWTVLGLAFLLLLPACGRDSRQVQGLVTEVQTGENGELTAFVVQTKRGEQVGVLLTEETVAVPTGDGPWSDGEMRAEFQVELQPDTWISSVCSGAKKKLTATDGTKIDAYEAANVYISGRMNRGAAVLSDGTPVDVLEDSYFNSDRTYYLNDTELLWVREPSGPEHHYVGGLESFDDLSETAQEKVRAWYEERGLLYDEEAELEKAYAAYLEQGEDFRSRMVEQDVSPSGSSQRVMYFGTHVTLPYDLEDSSNSYTLSLGEAFDRETGEYLSLWDLFRCSQEEARQAIIDAALDWRGSGGVRAGLEAAFDPERVVVGTDSLYMHFEPGIISEETTGYAFNADLSKLKDLMYDWAVPKTPE